MQFGVYTIGDRTADVRTGRVPTDHDRLKGMARIAVRAESAGFDVFAAGEHHNPPYASSAPAVLLGYVAAQTSRLLLSTATTLITTNDPVRIAEEYATLQHLCDGRLDVMLGRGNTGPARQRNDRRARRRPGSAGKGTRDKRTLRLPISTDTRGRRPCLRSKISW